MAAESEILLTVFLKHQQDKNLGEINAKLTRRGSGSSSRRRASRSSPGT